MKKTALVFGLLIATIQLVASQDTTRIGNIISLLANSSPGKKSDLLFKHVKDDLKIHDFSKAYLLSNWALSNFTERSSKYQIYLDLALATEGMGKIKTASLYLDSAAIFSKLPTSEYLLSKARINTGMQNYALAEELLVKADSIFPFKDFPEVNYNIQMEKAALCISKGDFEKGIEIYKELLKYYSKKSVYSKLHSVYNSLGMAYYQWGDFTRSLENYTLAISTVRFVKNDTALASYLNNMGVLNNIWKKNPKAEEYLLQALAINRRLGIDYEIATNYNNLGTTYNSMGNYKKALECHERSFLLKKELGLEKDMINVLNNIGFVYKSINRTDEALAYLDSAYRIALRLGDNDFIMLYYNNMGVVSLEKKDYRSAINFFNKSLEIAYKQNQREKISNLYHHLSVAYERTADYKTALGFFRKYSLLKDSIYTSQGNEQLARFEKIYETEKKEQEINRIKQEKRIQSIELENQKERAGNQLIMLLGALLILIVVFVLVFITYRYRSRFKMESVLKDQQKAIFKAAIEAQEQERKRFAEDLHDNIGQMLSAIRLNAATLDERFPNAGKDEKEVLKGMLEMLDETVNETRNISHNLMPSGLIRIGLIPAVKEMIRKINLSGKIIVEFQADENIPKMNETLEVSLYRIIQEILQNGLKHSGASVISVKMIIENGRLLLSVSDNGKGMDPDLAGEKAGIGWKNIQSRIAMHNGTIRIESEMGSGLKITISTLLE